MDHGGGGQGVGAQGPAGGLLHRLDPRQGLHLHGAQEPHVTGWVRGGGGAEVYRLRLGLLADATI